MPSGKFTKNKKEAAHLLLDTHFPCNSKADNESVDLNTHIRIQTNTHSDAVNNVTDKIITPKKVE